MEFPEEARKKLEEYLATHDLPAGLGSEEAACSVAAINLALTGTLTDKIPNCMSYVIGRWMIRIQDAMPSDIRNSQEWKFLLPLAAGTGRQYEQERRKIVVAWLWETVIPYFQSYADRIGMGDEWREMTEKRDYDSAIKARDVARVIRDKNWTADAAAVAAVAVAAADAAAAAADADADAADAAPATSATDGAADAAAAAAAAVAAADADAAAAAADAAVAARKTFW